MIVSVDVPAPFASVAGLNEHAGGAEVAGVILQDNVTEVLKPPVAEIVIVDVADPPGETEAGEGATAETVKFDTVVLIITFRYPKSGDTISGWPSPLKSATTLSSPYGKQC